MWPCCPQIAAALLKYLRAKRDHGTVWRPVNNPISRRTDETKSVTSDLVTQMRCSSPESALSWGATALKGTEMFEVIFLFWAPNSQPHSMVLALLSTLCSPALSPIFPKNYFLCALTENKKKVTKAGAHI